jgi:opacity protein-like surface antigen
VTKTKLAPLFGLGLLLVLLAPVAEAQRYHFYNDRFMEPSVVLELGVSGGIMNCMTDIGGNKNSQAKLLKGFSLQKTQFSGGLYVAGVYNDLLAVRLDYNFGRIEAIDSLLKGATDPSTVGRYERNLSFRSTIRELALNVELHPIFFIDYLGNGTEPPRFSPYVFAGLGWLSFDPQANIDNRWVRLEPLRLEGQGFKEYPDRKRYKTQAIAIPVGVGLKYEWTQLITLRLEVNRRFTNTDYLDDVSQAAWVTPSLFYQYLQPSQADLAARLYNRSARFNPPQDTRPRGNPKAKDAYWSGSFKLGFNINRRLR